jgi:hypothetical protein
MRNYVILLAAIFVAPSLFAQNAQNLSVREKRLNTTTKFQIDPSVVNVAPISETIFNETKLEETLISKPAFNQTIRVNNRTVLKSVSSAKKRRITHLREWP